MTCWTNSHVDLVGGISPDHVQYCQMSARMLVEPAVKPQSVSFVDDNQLSFGDEPLYLLSRQHLRIIPRHCLLWSSGSGSRCDEIGKTTGLNGTCKYEGTASRRAKTVDFVPVMSVPNRVRVLCSHQLGVPHAYNYCRPLHIMGFLRVQPKAAE